MLLLVFPSDILAGTPKMTWDEIMFNGGVPIHPTVTFTVLNVTFRYCICTFIFLYIYKRWSQNKYKEALSQIANISTIFIGLGVIEFTFKYFFGFADLWGYANHVFWGDFYSSVFEARERGGMKELNLFMQESSHYAFMLTLACIIRMTNNVIHGKNSLDVWIWVALALMLLSSSFSSVYLSVSFFAFYFSYRWFILRPNSARYEKTLLLTIIPTLVISGEISVSMFGDGFIIHRLSNIIDNFDVIFSTEAIYVSSMADNSTLVRMASMIQALLAFFKRPVFGYSLSAIHAHSTTAMFLAGVGVWGLLCWIKFYFKILPLYKMTTPVRNLYFFGIFMLLFVNMLAGDMRCFFSPILLITAVCFCFLYAPLSYKETNRNVNNNI